MPKLEQRVLKNDIFKADRALLAIEREHGKASPQYREALTRFVRLWSVLKLSRHRDEFFSEVARKTTQA